jgi:hypothetical protein
MLTAAGVTASGCTIVTAMEKKGTTPVPLGEVLQSLEIDLSRSQPLVLSDMPKSKGDGTESPQLINIRNRIAAIQCYDRDPKTGEHDPKLRVRNPLIPVVTGALQLTVQGQFATAGTVTVGAPPSAGGTITRQAQQQIMLPVTLVPLINLPMFYLGQQMSSIQSVPLVSTVSTVKPDNDQNAQIGDYVSRTLDVTTSLGKLSTTALDQFDSNPKYCDGKGGDKVLPVVVTVPIQ